MVDLGFKKKICFIFLFCFLHSLCGLAGSAHSDVSQQNLVIVTSLGFNTHALFIGVSHHSCPTSDLDKPNSFLNNFTLEPDFCCCANIFNVYVVFFPSQIKKEVAVSLEGNLLEVLREGIQEHNFLVWYVL